MGWSKTALLMFVVLASLVLYVANQKGSNVLAADGNVLQNANMPTSDISISCDIKKEGGGPHVVVMTLRNNSKDIVKLREPTEGSNYRVWYKVSNQAEYWPMTPPGSFLQSEIIEINPLEVFVQKVEWLPGRGEYDIYCDYSSLEGDAEVSWYGAIRSEVVRIKVE